MSLFDGYEGLLDFGNKLRFDKINRDVCRELGELRNAILRFDLARHAWAEIVANNNPPGRDSELRTRLEVMQGQALMEIEGAGLRIKKAMEAKAKESL